MKKLWEKIKNMDSHRRNHIVMRVTLVLLALLVIYRFASFGFEQYKTVFNLTRDANTNGVPVNVIEMAKTNGVIYEPLFVNNNRAFVSSMRVARFKSGQKITGGGEVISVSSSLDLDTGMHVVHTRGASNGAHTVEIQESGFYVPTYAVKNGIVFVVRDGVAHAVAVNVVRGDAENTMINGVADGDVVIISNITDGDLVKIVK